MKIRADENVSLKIVWALRDFGLPANWELSSTVEARQTGQADIRWVDEFAKQGGDAILTADRDFVTNALLIRVVHEMGLKVVLFPRAFSTSNKFEQAAHVFRWWKRIEAELPAMSPGECRRTEWREPKAERLGR